MLLLQKGCSVLMSSNCISIWPTILSASPHCWSGKVIPWSNTYIYVLVQTSYKSQRYWTFLGSIFGIQTRWPDQCIQYLWSILLTLKKEYWIKFQKGFGLKGDCCDLAKPLTKTSNQTILLITKEGDLSYTKFYKRGKFLNRLQNRQHRLNNTRFNFASG